MNYLSMILISFMIIMLTFVINFNNLLMSLLILEGMMLMMVLFIPLTILNLNSFIYQISLIMLTFSACEASLGLSLIVKLTRTHGTDMLSSLSINKC